MMHARVDQSSREMHHRINDYQQESNTNHLHLPASLTLGFKSLNFDFSGIIPILRRGQGRQFMLIPNEFVFWLVFFSPVCSPIQTCFENLFHLEYFWYKVSIHQKEREFLNSMFFQMFYWTDLSLSPPSHHLPSNEILLRTPAGKIDNPSDSFNLLSLAEAALLFGKPLEIGESWEFELHIWKPLNEPVSHPVSEIWLQSFYLPAWSSLPVGSSPFCLRILYPQPTHVSPFLQLLCHLLSSVLQGLSQKSFSSDLSILGLPEGWQPLPTSS